MDDRTFTSAPTSTAARVSAPSRAATPTFTNELTKEIEVYEKQLAHIGQRVEVDRKSAERALTVNKKLVSEGQAVQAKMSLLGSLPGVGVLYSLKAIWTGEFTKPEFVPDAQRAAATQVEQLKRFDEQKKSIDETQAQVARAKKFIVEGKPKEAEKIIASLRTTSVLEDAAKNFDRNRKENEQHSRTFGSTAKNLERAQTIVETVRDGSAMAGAIAAAPTLGVVGATAAATGVGAVVNIAGEGAHISQGVKSSREAMRTVLERTGESAITGVTTGVGMGAAKLAAQGTARLVGRSAFTVATSGAAGSLAFSNVQSGVSLLRGQEFNGSDYVIDMGTGVLAGALGAQSGAVREELRSVTKKGLALGAELAGDIGLGIAGAYAKASKNGADVSFGEVVSQVHSSVVGSTVGEISSSQVTRVGIAEAKQVVTREGGSDGSSVPEFLTTRGGNFPIPERVERSTNDFSWDTYRPKKDGVLLAQNTNESGGGSEPSSDNKLHGGASSEIDYKAISQDDVRAARRVIRLQALGERVFSEALSIVQDMADPNDRASALSAIGFAQVKAGLLSKANLTAEGMENSIQKAYVLGKLGIAQAKLGIDPSPAFSQALTMAREIEDSGYRAYALKVFSVDRATAGLFSEALETAREIKNPIVTEVALREIAAVQAGAGLVSEAFSTVRLIGDPNMKISALADIGIAQAKAGNDPAPTFSEAFSTVQLIDPYFARLTVKSHTNVFALRSSALEKIGVAQVKAGLLSDALETARSIDDSVRASFIVKEIASAQADAGLISDALSTAQGIKDSSYKAFAFGSIGLAQARAGMNPAAIFAEALSIARGIERLDDRSIALSETGISQADAGLFSDAFSTAQEITVSYDKQRLLEGISVAQAKAGLFADAVSTARAIENSDGKASALGHIAAEALSATANVPFSASEVLRNDSAFLIRVLSGKHDRVAEDVGFLAPKETTESLIKSGTLPTFQRQALELGAAEGAGDFRAAGSVASRVKADSLPVEKRALARTLSHQPDPLQNSILLEKLRTEGSDQAAVRYLRTLVEGDSPKGRTIATELAVDPRVNEKRREFLVKLLFDSGHWDNTLGRELEGELRSGKTTKNKVDEILHGLVTELGLTPDRNVYRALEGDGLLGADTVPGRIKELQSYRSRFEGRTWEELRSILGEDPRLSKIFYMLKGGEQQYALINDYSYSKFTTILDKANALVVDPRGIAEFERSVVRSGKSAEDARKISSEMLEGRFPGLGEKRVVEFTTDVVKGSTHEEALSRMQDIWQTEFRGLLLAGVKKGEVANINQVRSQLGETHDAVQSLRELGKDGISALQLLERVKLDEKLTPQRVEEIAKDLRSSLTQRAKSNKDKLELERVKGLSSSEVITEYVATVVPGLRNSGALQEWRSHLDEVTAELKRENRTAAASSRSFELTFLDKGKDLMRALRFADAQRCCFNSTNYNLSDDLGSADWIARLHRDPLSFVVDIKPQGTDVITGFVFGRMGTHRENGKPIVMLNGIYSQLKGPSFNDNVLAAIEEGFATKIGASKIVLASEHGGTLSTPPSGYTQQTFSLRALRALPESRTYDDIGTVANGLFLFSGYVKDLTTNESSK